MAGGWRAPLAQTAVNDAAQIVAAQIAAGSLDGNIDDILTAFDAVADHVFARLDAVKVRDDEAYEANGGGEAKSAPRAKKTFSGKGKGKAINSVEDALSMKLTWGAFKGVALGDLVEMDASTCDDDYGYGDGAKDGKDYVSWLAGSAKFPDLRKAAQFVADEFGIDYTERD